MEKESIQSGKMESGRAYSDEPEFIQGLDSYLRIVPMVRDHSVKQQNEAWQAITH